MKPVNLQLCNYLHLLNEVFASGSKPARLTYPDDVDEKDSPGFFELTIEMLKGGKKMELTGKGTSIIAFAGAFLLTMAVVVFSQGPQGPSRRGGGPGPRDGLGPIVRDLNLTDEQKAQIKTITESFEESAKGLRDQLRTLHKSETDPLTGTFDEAAVRAAAEARAKIDVELSVARAKMMSQVGGLLTTDQKAQLAARRREFGPKPPPPPAQ